MDHILRSKAYTNRNGIGAQVLVVLKVSEVGRLAGSVGGGHVTLDLRAVSSSPMLGEEIT